MRSLELVLTFEEHQVEEAVLDVVAARWDGIGGGGRCLPQNKLSYDDSTSEGHHFASPHSL